MNRELTLRPMDQTRFNEYLKGMLPHYAEEGARATGMSHDDAIVQAEKQLQSLLPDGPRTEGQFLYDLVDGAGARVGILWYAAQLDQVPPRVFIYDIEIHESQRGRGLGSAAMRLLEVAARSIGAEQVMLHVFAHNEGAVRLYERLGYEADKVATSGMRMVKAIPPAE